MLPVNGFAKKSGKKGTKKISRCARNDSVGDGYPVHHTKNVWETRSSRIVIGSGAEGSFSLAVRRRASDGEKWETPYHGKWKRRVSRIVIPSEVEGSFSLAVRWRASDGEKRETPYHGKWKRRVSRIVIGSRAEGSFSLAVRRRASDGEKRETPCRGKAGAVLPVNGLAKEEGKEGRKRFLATLEMTAWGMAIPCIIQRMCGKNTFPVSSSEAKSRDLFRWR